MKRIFTISVAAVMALLMVLSLTACGNSTLGYYKLTSAEASGMSFDSSTLAAVGMDKGYILLKEDGKAKLSAAGQEQELTYDDKNFTAGSESIPYTLKDGVITMENHTVIGGLGTAVAEVMVENQIGKKLIKVGIQDEFTHGASKPYLMKKYGLDATALINAVEKIIGKNLNFSEADLDSIRLEDYDAV